MSPLDPGSVRHDVRAASRADQSRMPVLVRFVLTRLVPLVLLCGWIAAPAPSAATRPIPLKIVVLGDSYSAGNGAGHYYGPVGCFRSSENWAEKYADWLGTQGYAVALTNRACSGSKSTHIYEARVYTDFVKKDSLAVKGGFEKDDPGLIDALTKAGNCVPKAPDESFHFHIKSATNLRVFTFVSFTCDRTLAPQMNAVGRDTDLVLLTMGGNDLAFGDIVPQCYLGGIVGRLHDGRDENTCRNLIESGKIIAQNGTLTNQIRTALQNLRARMRPDAHIALNAYPQVDSDPPPYALGSYQVNKEIRLLGTMGDAAQQRAVDLENADTTKAQTTFVPDIKPCFAGHEPWGSWELQNPERWIWEFERGPFNFAIGDQKEIYHPNPTGHTEWANCLHKYGAFGASGAVTGKGDVDVVFVIDTTGSMFDDIAAVKSFASQFVDLLQGSTSSYRVALVTYRDWPSWTGDPSDYPSRLDLDFTDNKSSITSAINAMSVSGGGDFPESVYSGLLRGIGLGWRPGVQKVVIQLGDAPPHDPEPVSGYTLTNVVDAAFAVDPAQVYVVDVSTGGVPDARLREIAQRTGGDVFSATSPAQVAQALTNTLNRALTKPFAWAGGPYVTEIGTPVELDASGSVDADGTIVSYEWDLNGDGVFDVTSTQPKYTYTFDAAFSGSIAVRVTDNDGNTAIATATADASVDGDEIPDAVDNCPAVSNHGQSDWDGDGIGDVCDDEPFSAPASTGRATVVAAGASHSLALMADGTVKAWGLGSSGQLGTGNKLRATTPVSVSGLTAVTSVAAGDIFSLALRSDGTVWAWGDNAHGQLGDGTKTQRLSPVQAVGLPPIVAIGAGGTHSLALAQDGTVWAWGGNASGQVGNGTTTDQLRPVQVAGVGGVVAVAGGGAHTLALRNDGTVIGWGANGNGQLGDGNRPTKQLTPVQAQGLAGVTAIAAGFQHSLAVTSTGVVWAWGENADGQLGDGTRTDRPVPTQVAGAGPAKAVAAGKHHSLALGVGGSVTAWGANNQGQLGDGTTTNRLVPVSGLGLATATALAAGSEHSLFVLADRTDRASGRNDQGELGDGTTTPRSSPVSVLSITDNAQP